MAVQTQIQVRRGTAASWTSTNPTLAAGEIGLETDTSKFKIGDGSSTWTSLAYYPTLGANTFTGAQTATSFIVTGSTIPANGVYLPAANSLGLSTNSTERFRIDSVGAVGFGSGAITAGQNFRLNKTLTGATSCIGILIQSQVQSDVTGSAIYYYSQPAVQDAAFTLPTLYHFYASQGTFGASATVTSQVGYFVNSNLTGAANNFGFYGNLAASGSSRYNLYMAGTAPNLLIGRVGIGGSLTSGAMFLINNTTASDVASIIRGAASQTGDLLQVQDSAATVLTRIDSSGKIGIGTGPSTELDIAKADSAAIRVRATTNAVDARLNTLGLTSNVGQIGTWSNHSLVIRTNDTERMRINTSGNVGIGTSSPTAKLDVNGSIVSNNLLLANPVINGAFDIWQRGTSIAGSTTAYTADRWNGYRAVAGSTFSRQTTGDTTNLPNIQYCARVQRDSGNTATNSIYFGQSMETVNSIPFAGKTVTISFYARKGANFSDAGSAINCSVITGTGTDQNNTTGAYTGSATPISQGATLTTTWQRFSYSGTIASTATEITTQFYYTPVGTAGAADYFEVTGVQIDLGNVALPFRRSGGTIQGELAACQRYYVRFTAGTYQPISTNGGSTTTTIAQTQFQHPVSMRIAPASIESGSLEILNYGNNTPYSGGTLSLASAAPDTSVVRYTHGSAVFTAGQVTGFRSSGSAGYIGLSAEL